MSKALVILSELSDSDIDWLIANGTRETVKKGEILIYEGKALDALYIVLSGDLSVSVKSSPNQEISRISSGEVLGEMSFIDGRLPSATVQAIEDSLILSISRQKLSVKLEQDVLFSLRFYRAITKFLSFRLRTTVSHFAQDTNANSSAESDSFIQEMDEQAERLNGIMKRLNG